MEVLRAYRVAFLQEDIDRLQELFLSEDEGALADSRLFLRAMTEAFRTRTFIDLEIPTEEIRIVSDSQSVSFLEIETIDEPVTMVRLTRAFRTNMWLEPRKEPGGIVSFRIAGIRRDGPVMQVTTPGQVIAGTPAHIKVAELTGSLRINEVTLQEGEGEPESHLAIVDNFFQGIFTPRAELQTLRIHIQGNRGEKISLQHQYRLRQADEWVVQQIGGTSVDARFFAVTAAPNGTIWAGGDRDPGFVINSGLLYQVPSGSITVSARYDFPGTLREGPQVRIEDLVIDQLERLHIVIASSTTSRVLVHNEGIFCQTVDIFDPAYPFHDLQAEPSASLRALAAGDGDIWLFAQK